MQVRQFRLDTYLPPPSSDSAFRAGRLTSMATPTSNFPSAVSRRRLKHAGLLSLLPLIIFLLYTAGYSNGLAPTVRPYDPESRIENSIVIPSYHEAENIPALVTRIFQAVESKDRDATEVVIVDDDSRDGTVEAVERLKGEGYNVVLFVRTDESGLSSAVLHGFKNARGSKFVVMDGACDPSVYRNV